MSSIIIEGTAGRERWAARLLRFFAGRLAFTVVVAVPTLLAVIYYGLIAADIYVSEAQFVVRSNTPRPEISSGLTAFFQSAGIVNSSDDSYSVAAYLTSRDVLRELEQGAELRAVYGRPEADFVAKFPNLLYRPSFENLFLHYSDWVTVEYDTTTGVSSLSVSAFRPDDAQRVAARLLDLGEKLVNKLNDRARHDTVAAARGEVENLQRDGVQIQKQVTDFRARELMLDPNASSTASLGRLASLEADMVATRALLSQVERSTPASPQIPGLRSRIDALQRQVAVEERRGSSGDGSLAPKMAEYEQLLLKQQFLQQMLQTAVASLESAQVTAQQQQLYVERISEPNLQDRPLHPYRFVNTLVVFLTALILYGIGLLIYSAIMEHRI